MSSFERVPAAHTAEEQGEKVCQARAWWQRFRYQHLGERYMRCVAVVAKRRLVGADTQVLGRVDPNLRILFR